MFSIESIKFNPAAPDDTRAQLEACLDDAELAFVTAYLSRGNPTYLNGSACVRLLRPELVNPAAKAYTLKRSPAVQLLIQWHLATHGLDRDRALQEIAGWVYDIDIADYEPYLTGELTLAELRDAGVNTKAITKASATTDGAGGVTRSVELIAKAPVMRDLLKAQGAFDHDLDPASGTMPTRPAENVRVWDQRPVIQRLLEKGTIGHNTPGVEPRQLSVGRPTATHVQAAQEYADLIREKHETMPTEAGRAEDEYPPEHIEAHGQGEEDAGPPAEEGE